MTTKDVPMTGGTAGRVTRWPWTIVTPYPYAGTYEIAEAINEEAFGNRALVLTAVAACFALNPTDPLSAAQHLEALVKAAQTAVNCMDVELQMFKENAKGWEAPRDFLRDVLSHVTGKP